MKDLKADSTEVRCYCKEPTAKPSYFKASNSDGAFGMRAYRCFLCSGIICAHPDEPATKAHVSFSLDRRDI